MHDPRPDAPDFELTAAPAGGLAGEDALQLGPADLPPPPAVADDPFAMHLADPKPAAAEVAEPAKPLKPAKAVTAEANDSVVAALMGRPISKAAKPASATTSPATPPAALPVVEATGEPLLIAPAVVEPASMPAAAVRAVPPKGNASETAASESPPPAATVSTEPVVSATPVPADFMPAAFFAPPPAPVATPAVTVPSIEAAAFAAARIEPIRPAAEPAVGSATAFTEMSPKPVAAVPVIEAVVIEAPVIEAVVPPESIRPEPVRPRPRRAVPVMPAWPDAAAASPAAAKRQPDRVESPRPSPAVAVLDPELPETAELPAGPTGAWWTIPLTFVGIAIVACAMLIPAADENRRDGYELSKIERDVDYFQRQSGVNTDFLRRVDTDPTLAERLALRQLHQTRAGVGLAPLAAKPDRFAASPYALTRVDPPAPLPPYQPTPGKLGEWFLGGKNPQQMAALGLLIAGAGVLIGGGRRRTVAVISDAGTPA